jgi:SAM-dependent MidA family methyltransferase
MPSPEFIAAFQERADAAGVMSFARFMDLALYHPAIGYYSAPRLRIGRTARADFFTAASLGPVFGELVAAACVDLLGQHSPGVCTFVEIGAESSGLGADEAAGVLATEMAGSSAVAHPFAAVQNIPLGQPLVIPPHSIVFSNELFDAQPCHRLVREEGRWQETGVGIEAGTFREILLPALSSEVQAVRDRLPASAPDGYRIDLPIGAARLAARIASQPWSGLFVAFDYGKSWRELSEDTPAGTVRAYFRHRQHHDLLVRPGQQDLTCHVCWDWIIEVLAAHGFETPTLESQEAFFVHHAAPALSQLATADATRFSSRKLGVMQLLHPGNMGRKFQVLWARRRAKPG